MLYGNLKHLQITLRVVEKDEYEIINTHKNHFKQYLYALSCPSQAGMPFMVKVKRMKIIRPTFLINEQICRNNIRNMARKARKHNLVFRPHFKTHQSAEIGEWFKDDGVLKITVSSVTMARYFSDNGWKNILIAFPVNILEIDDINQLSSQISLHLTVESVKSVISLNENLKFETGVYIKIDTGYHRTGISIENKKTIEEILKIIKTSDKLNFIGFLTHAGNTYSTKQISEIIDIHESSISQLNELKLKFSNDFPGLIISIGDTPSCSVVDNFGAADEIRPGNFVFYDVMQLFLGSCKIEDIGVVLACPVVAKHPERNEIVIYGGAVHLSKESVKNMNGNTMFGLVVNIHKNRWSKPIADTYVNRLSQEHGILKTSTKVFNSIHVGDIIGILPVHSCLTANLANDYLIL